MSATDAPARSGGGFWRVFWHAVMHPPEPKSTPRQNRAQLRADQLANARAIRARHDPRGIRP